MTFPVVESLTPTVFVSGTSHLVAMPATVNAGDLLIVGFTNANSATTVTNPSGWSELHTTIFGGAARLGDYYKIAAGTEGGTTVDFVTSAARRAVAHCYRISGWHGTTPPEVGTMATGSSVNPDPPNLAPSWGAADTLWLEMVATAGLSAFSVYSTNYTDGADDSAAVGAPTLASARRALNAASDDPSALTMDTNVPWGAQTLAIRPQSGNTGTIAVTQGADVGAISGTVANPISGTIAVTQANQTMAATGTETLSGTVAATQAAQTAAISGSVANPISGTVAATQAPNTGNLAGSLGIIGTIGATQASNTGALTGTVANPITGTVAVVQANQTSNIMGTTVSDATVNAIQADQTGAFNGTVANPVTGILGATQASQTGTLSGTVTSVAVVGTIGVTQEGDMGAFSGSQTLIGVTGVLGATQGSDVGAFTGLNATAVTGTIAATQASQTFTGTGNVGNPSEGAVVTVTCELGGPTVTCTVSPEMIIAGSNAVVTAKFYDTFGTLSDPGTVTATVQAPDGTISNPTPSSSSTGIWTTTIPTDQAGYWFYQISGTGVDIDVVCTGSFCAQPSLVLV